MNTLDKVVLAIDFTLFTIVVGMFSVMVVDIVMYKLKNIIR